MMNPHMAMKKGNGTTVNRPISNEPDSWYITPTKIGPIAAAKGVKVLMSPIASAISLGCNFISNGIVMTIGMTMNALTPAVSKAIARTIVFGVTSSNK
jgi:hypothetical protein